MNADDAKTLAIAGAAAVVGLVLLKFSGAAQGALTGDNALTRNATNADGQPVTAYQGAGVVGTLGAATNAASGGYLASLGQWLGGAIFDLTHPTETGNTGAAPDVFVKPAGQAVAYSMPVAADLTFSEASQAGYDWRGYGWGVLTP